ncbi:MAG: hypothetical protein HYT13_00125 [Candidatus Liptonbacteria bacterium]|nr:hypothetical protein [Candidatus Liptonbacteria bacterium]
MKRFLFIFGALVIMVAVIGIGYLLRYRSSAPEGIGLPETTAPEANLPPDTTSPTPTTPPTLTPPPGQKLSLASQNPIRDYFLDSQNNLTLIEPDGQIVKITKSGSSILSSTAIQNLISASFSYDGQKILAIFGDRKDPQISIFDIQTKSWQSLDLKFESASWSPTSYKIAYFSLKAGFKFLTITDIGDPKSKPQELLKMGVEDIIPLWIGPQEILLKEKNSAFWKSSSWLFDIQKNTLTTIIQDQLGLEFLWDRATGRSLMSVSNLNNKGGRLSLVDKNGNLINRLNFITFPSKCIFGGAKISTSTFVLNCAVPRDQQKLSSTVLPDAYQKKAIFTSDDFYEIDLTNGSVKIRFSDLTKNFDADNLKVFLGRLYFVNRYDNRLYSISLSN